VLKIITVNIFPSQPELMDYEDVGGICAESVQAKLKVCLMLFSSLL
jgi:hypothetical protein